MSRSISRGLLWLVAGCLACSDDRRTPVDADIISDQSAVADTITDIPVDLVDITPHDVGPPPPCSDKIVGTKCTAAGGECGADHSCLLVTPTGGFCTCSCRMEDPSTSVREDTCPGSQLICAPHAPPGGTEKSYCFRFFGNAEPYCVNKITHNWDTPLAFPYANLELSRLTPTTPFTVVGARYILGGTGAGGSIPCDSTVPHRVDTWVDKDPTPTAAPVPVTTTPVASAAQGKYVITIVTFDKALPIASGEHLFVAVEMSNAVPDKAMCIVNCGVGTTGEKSYTSWTNAPVNNNPPYQWSSYKTMGSSQDLSTLALGFEGTP